MAGSDAMVDVGVDVGGGVTVGGNVAVGEGVTVTCGAGVGERVAVGYGVFVGCTASVEMATDAVAAADGVGRGSISSISCVAVRLIASGQGVLNGCLSIPASRRARMLSLSGVRKIRIAAAPRMSAAGITIRNPRWRLAGWATVAKGSSAIGVLSAVEAMVAPHFPQ